MRLLLALALFALVFTPTALAAPPCTCDPNPITDLARCIVNGDTCPPAVEGLDLPSLKDLLEPQPCTCDPQPTPI